MKRPLNQDKEWQIIISKLTFLASYYHELGQRRLGEVILPAGTLKNKIFKKEETSFFRAFVTVLVGLPVTIGAGALNVATLPLTMIGGAVYMSSGRSFTREKSIQAIIDILKGIEGENKGSNNELLGTVKLKYIEEKEKILSTPSRTPRDRESGYIDLLQILSQVDDRYGLEENILTKMVRMEAYKRLSLRIPDAIIKTIIWGYIIHEELAAFTLFRFQNRPKSTKHIT